MSIAIYHNLGNFQGEKVNAWVATLDPQKFKVNIKYVHVSYENSQIASEISLSKSRPINFSHWGSGN